MDKEFNKANGMEPYNSLIDCNDGSSMLWDSGIQFIDVYSDWGPFLNYTEPLTPWLLEERVFDCHVNNKTLKFDNKVLESDNKMLDFTDEENENSSYVKVVDCSDHNNDLKGHERVQLVRIYRDGTIELHNFIDFHDTSELCNDASEESNDRLNPYCNEVQASTHKLKVNHDMPASCDESTTWQISKERVQLIFYVLGYFLNHHYEGSTDLSSGSWMITLYKDESVMRHITGSLPICKQPILYGLSVSHVLRDLLDEPKVLLFDGDPDYVEEFYFSYACEHSSGRVYTETLRINRSDLTLKYEKHYSHTNSESATASASIGHLQTGQLGMANDVVVELQSRTLVLELLEELDNVEYFTKPVPRKLVPDLEPYKRTYELKLSGKSGAEFTCQGGFHKDGLPDEWPDFAFVLDTTLKENIKLGDIVKESLYEHAWIPDEEALFCMVELPVGLQEYTYLCTDDTIKIGDTVEVPVGAENIPTKGVVRNMIRALPKNAPYPYRRIKKVIRKLESS